MNSTDFLDEDQLVAVDPPAIRESEPYPWRGFEGLLTEAGYRQLREALPGLELFRQRVGKRRTLKPCYR